MTITQTVEITDSRRLTIDVTVPREIPIGRSNVIIQFPVQKEHIKKRITEEEEKERINRIADRLKEEMQDILSVQCWHPEDVVT